MASKMILRRQKSARQVESSIQSHGMEAESAAHRALAPFLEEGEAPPPLEMLQRLCHRGLRHHQHEIVLRDEAHLRELRGGSEGR